MTPPIAYRLARPEQWEPIRALVASAGLPHADLSPVRQEFVVALRGAELVGCAGLEVHGGAALLRSFAVEPGLRGGGLGTALLGRVLALASARGLRDAYLLTTTAERFFLRHGFARLDRASVPAPLAASAEFRALCPASAVCMHREVEGQR